MWRRSVDDADATDTADGGGGGGGGGGGRRRVRLDAFGRSLSLRLEPASGLLKGGHLRLWEAKGNVSGDHQVDYVEVPKVRHYVPLFHKRTHFFFVRHLFVSWNFCLISHV